MIFSTNMIDLLKDSRRIPSNLLCKEYIRLYVRSLTPLGHHHKGLYRWKVTLGVQRSDEDILSSMYPKRIVIILGNVQSVGHP